MPGPGQGNPPPETKWVTASAKAITLPCTSLVILCRRLPRCCRSPQHPCTGGRPRRLRRRNHAEPAATGPIAMSGSRGFLSHLFLRFFSYADPWARTKPLPRCWRVGRRPAGRRSAQRRLEVRVPADLTPPEAVGQMPERRDRCPGTDPQPPLHLTDVVEQSDRADGVGDLGALPVLLAAETAAQEAEREGEHLAPRQVLVGI